MNMPPIVSPQEGELPARSCWSRRRSSRALGMRSPPSGRRMPWMAVETDYRFEGPDGPGEPRRPVRAAVAS